MNQLPAPTIREKLKLRHLGELKRLGERHPLAILFLSDKGLSLAKIREHSAKALAAGALAGTLALAPPVHAAPPLPPPVIERLLAAAVALPDQPEEFLKKQLAKLLPGKPGPLSQELEKNIGLLIERLTGIRARGTLEGEHLNTTYGFIGAEQHLPRFPGDTIALHDQLHEAGITPGRGAWGYFATSRLALAPEDIQREKYYVAVQTMYLPDWGKRLRYLRDWYKYRKVMVVNPENGKTVVAVVADSGPAAWTGKHFGGSPEVMNALGGPGYKKGAVLLFFVDDPENQVKLGPVEHPQLTKPEVAEAT